MAKVKKLTIPTVGKEIKQLPPSHINSGTVRWYNLFGKLFGSFL